MPRRRLPRNSGEGNDRPNRRNQEGPDDRADQEVSTIILRKPLRTEGSTGTREGQTWRTEERTGGKKGHPGCIPEGRGRDPAPGAGDKRGQVL